MKKFSLWFFAVVATIFTIVFAFSPLQPTIASADGAYFYVYDKANLFNENEISDINAAARKAKLNTKEKCIFYIGTYSGVLNDDTGNSFLANLNISLEENSVLLLISHYTNSYHYWLYTYGNATHKIKDSEVDKILDNTSVYNNLKTGNLEEGTISFLSLATNAYNTNYVKIFFISLGISIIVAILSCAGVIYKYKKLKKVADYPLDKFTKTHITDKQDILVNTFVSKTPINTGSSNRSGGSHGGGSHGGGGHSRGGR